MIGSTWSSPPGDTISRLMRSKEVEADELADILGISRNDFSTIIAGNRRLTERDAIVLSENLGSTARFWLARDKAYVLDLARLSEQNSDGSDESWLESMPVSSMRKYGWVQNSGRSKDKLKAEVLAFFGCQTIKEWGNLYSTGVGAVAFRTSLTLASDDMATLVWLRAGEILISGRNLPKFNRVAFKRILPTLKKLSAYKRPSTFLPRLIEACHSVGVAVATARAPEGCRASGASWFNASGNPAILLSFRHMADDHFWFTFFHEAGHVVLHGQNHIDGEGAIAMGGNADRQEIEANKFAQEVLFPIPLREKLMDQGVRPSSIIAIARKSSVTPGIIVGQLQRSKELDHNKMNFLKRRYRWDNDPHVPILID
jgi:HTH-type transcriptional regulator / antitoxin HigA